MKERMKERRAKPTFDEFVASTAALVEAWPDWKRVSAVPTPPSSRDTAFAFPTEPPTYTVEPAGERWTLVRIDGLRISLGGHPTKKDAVLQGHVFAMTARGVLIVPGKRGRDERIDYTRC